jgi:hypothetical protein
VLGPWLAGAFVAGTACGAPRAHTAVAVRSGLASRYEMHEIRGRAILEVAACNQSSASGGSLALPTQPRSSNVRTRLQNRCLFGRPLPREGVERLNQIPSASGGSAVLLAARD